MKIYLNGET